MMLVTVTNFVIYYICFFILLLLYWYYNYNRYNRPLRKYSGPPTIPLFGNALKFSRTQDIITNLMKWQKEYGKVFKVYIGFGHPRLVITDYKILETVLGTTNIMDKGRDYKFFHQWLGSGLLTSSGNRWKKHRTILTPAFHFTILEQFLNVFESASNILIDKLRAEVGKDSVDIAPLVTLCSLDILCETSLGTKINAQLNSESEYVQSVKQMCRILVERALSPLKMFDLCYYFSRDYRIEQKAIGILHSTTRSVITHRKEQLEKDKDDEAEEYGKKKKCALLDLLLQYRMEGQKMTDEDIREEVDTFMFEGHDTTSSAINFALYSIAQNPDIQQNIVKELNEIFSETDRQATMQDLQSMKYLGAVIQETLRLYPSVPIYTRHVYKDTELDGITIRKGTEIIIFAFGIHRQEEYFPNPEKFDPTRFLNFSNVQTFSYIPFSAGPRNCIGQKFAMLELKSVLSKILRNFEVSPTEPPHQVDLVPETVLKSGNGVCIRLHERQKVES